MGDSNERAEARPKKLRSGDWGCTVAGPVTPGEIVTIRTSRGKSWPAVIDKVIWSDDSTSICTTREREDADKTREAREGPVPDGGAPAAREPAPRQQTPAGSTSRRAHEADGVPAAPPTPPAQDADFDAMADAQAQAQAERAAEEDEVLAMAHTFSHDF